MLRLQESNAPSKGAGNLLLPQLGTPNKSTSQTVRAIQRKLPKGVRQFKINDPRVNWANGRGAHPCRFRHDAFMGGLPKNLAREPSFQ
jgi:hypothetical protein